MTAPCAARVPAPFPLVSRPCGEPSAAAFAARCEAGHEGGARVCRDCAGTLQQQGRFGCSRCPDDCPVTAELRWDDGSVTVLQGSDRD